jgi:hypothetical protein
MDLLVNRPTTSAKIVHRTKINVRVCARTTQGYQTVTGADTATSYWSALRYEQNVWHWQNCTRSCVFGILLKYYEGVSRSFRTDSITKYTLTFDITRWEATQRVMAVKLTRLIHKTVIQLHLVAESCTICSSHSRRPVWNLLDTPTYSGDNTKEG